MKYKRLTYVDLNDGELMHWKYVKREKLPNGKWRYYYEDDVTKANEEVTKRVKEEMEAHERTQQAYRNMNTAADKTKMIVVDKKGLETRNNYIDEYRKAEQAYQDSYADWETAQANTAAASKKQKEARAKQKNESFIDDIHRAASKGAVAVANIFARNRKKSG